MAVAEGVPGVPGVSVATTVELEVGGTVVPVEVGRMVVAGARAPQTIRNLSIVHFIILKT